MVREIRNKNYVLKYGKDHIEGLFFEVKTYDGVLIHSDSQENNLLLTMPLIAEFAEEYGFDLSDEVEVVIDLDD